MKYKTIICCAIILSNALCWGYVGRRVVGGPVVVNNNNQLTISIPDDVKDYTNRVQQCYYLKEETTKSDNNELMQQTYRCKYLSDDSQHMHSLYFTNQKIIDYINKYEKNYPFN